MPMRMREDYSDHEERGWKTLIIMGGICRSPGVKSCNVEPVIASRSRAEGIPVMKIQIT